MATAYVEIETFLGFYTLTDMNLHGLGRMQETAVQRIKDLCSITRESQVQCITRVNGEQF